MNDNSSVKTQAIKLRQNGVTFRQVAKSLKLPLSTTHLWTKHIKLSSEQIINIKTTHRQSLKEGQHNYLSKQKRIQSRKNKLIFKQGFNKIKNLSHRELMLVGTALYWAEGFKKDSRLGFANSDPHMIQLTLEWLYNIGKVPKNDIRLRVGINISHQHRIAEVEKRWSKITNIPLNQFQKPFFQKTKLKKKYSNQEKYLGVLRIRANNQTKYFKEIIGMIEGLKQSKTPVIPRL